MATHPQRVDESRRRPFNTVSYVSLTQGLYYLLMGIWPLISLAAPALSRPVSDPWLVSTASVFSVASGAVLILAGLRRREALAEIALLGILTAAGLAAIDIAGAANRLVARIYLADAAFQIAFIIFWAMAWRGRSQMS